MTMRKMHTTCKMVRFFCDIENKKVGKMPKATNPGFQYHENTSKNIAASLKGLHIVSLPSQIKKCKITMKIIILVKPEYIIFIIYGI